MIGLAVLGLWLPGYALARALRAPMAWAAAFPLSALLIAEVVIAYTLVGIPLIFDHVAMAVAAVSVIAAVVWYGCPRAPAVSDVENELPFVASHALKIVIGVPLFMVGLGVFVRAYLWPLSGGDTVTRWDALSWLMFQYENLSYYPPQTAADFSKYTYPDGFPPLVSAVYWWLYAAWGKPFPALTSLVVLLQLISCLGLAFCAARMRFGAAAGLVALVILTTSSFFLYSVAIGQETGYTALSYAGQLGFAYAATRRPRAGMVVIAGLFAGLGALAREYGPVLSLCGFVVLACERQTWKYLPLFVLVAAVCGAPWYVRNWVLTGNPVYSTNIGLGFAVNPVHAGELALYRERFGIHTLSAAAWLGVVWRAISGAPLVWLIGLPGVVAVGRKTPAIGISVLVVLFVWLLSINYTAGGVEYSMRVLTPAYVALATAGGYFGGALLQPTGKRKKLVVAIAYLLIVLCGGYAILGCWSHPYPAHLIRETIATTRDGPMDDANPVAVFAKQFEALGFSPARVLTDDAVLAVALRRYTHSQPVMIYSPEVAFVFDKRIEPAEACRRLIADGIGFVALNYLSNTNFFLAQFPFYHDAMTQGVDDSWRLVLGVPDFKWIFSLVPVSKSQSTPNLRPELPPNGLTRKGRS